MPAKGIDYPLVRQTYQERSPEMDTRYVANYYITYDPEGTKPLMFNPTPGYIAQYVLNVSSNPVRQIYSDQNDAYSYALAFSADVVYLLSGTARSTRIGNINTASGFIGVTSSTSQVMFVDGSAGYVYDISAETITTITSDNFPANPLDCVFFNNYFVALQKNSNQWFVSAAGDALTWNSQNSVVFNAKADTLKGCAAVNNVLFIFGKSTTEVWYPQANGTFPFSYNSNMLFEYGCIATGSIAEGQGILIWLAGDKNGVGSIYMSNGTTPDKISTKAVDYALRQYGDVSDAVGFIYKEAGHIFYQISFPSANKTWLADLTPDNGGVNWTNLTELDGSYHAAICHTYFNDKHLVGSKDSSVVYNLSSNIITQNLLPVHRVVQGSSYMLPMYNRFKVANFEVNFQGGSGNSNDPGRIPKSYLSVSTDEGHTFSHQRPAEIGRIGEYRYRANWYGCGVTRSFTPRIDVYDPVGTYILGAKMVIEEGSA
jgi:hypothetical protein